MESADEPPHSKKAKLSSAPVVELPDSLLAQIFAYLSFKDRHQLCLVSSKWAAASRIPWSDITFLDLGTIPRVMVDSILGLCPMLQELCAKDVTINLDEKSSLPISANLRTMAFRNVRFTVNRFCGIRRTNDRIMQLLSEFFSRFPALIELTWQDVTYADSCEVGAAACCRSARSRSELFAVLPAVTAASIRRLILMASKAPPSNETSVFMCGSGLTNLECLYWLEDAYVFAGIFEFELPNLREVCLSGAILPIETMIDDLFGGNLPNLEVLIVASEKHLRHEQISRLLQRCAGLRILAIAGGDEYLALNQRMKELLGEVPTLITLPAPALRQRLPTVQPLQVFVGGNFTDRVRFTLPKKSESANFWRIDCPMPEFLPKPEVSKIFKDVWLAKIIREGPENGLLPWGHPNEMNLFYSTSPLSFC